MFMKQGEKTVASTQAYLPISEIREGTVILKDGSMRAVVIVSSFNFALKSDDEKNAIISSYQEFLNSLSFPIQIVSNSRKIDLSLYLNEVKQAAAQQTNPLIKIQTEEYHNFIQQLLDVSNIMEKRFFVVVPYYPFGINESTGLPNPFKKKEAMPQSNLEENRKKLLERVEEIISGLSSVGLRCAALGTEDLLELYYSIYNPDTAKNQKIKSADDLNIALTSSNTEPGVPKGQNGNL